jgi:hypothetical protein
LLSIFGISGNGKGWFSTTLNRHQMINYRVPVVRLAAAIALVLTAALLQLPTAALGAVSGQPPTSTVVNSLPSGLVAVIEMNKKDDRSWRQALNNSNVSGVALQIHWSDIEPVEGKPDWSKLDELFAAAESSKKWVQLLIFPGFFTPAWAEEGVETDQFAIQYGPGKGTVETLPMPWDTVYLNRWFAFLKLLSDRYGKSPAFRLVAADGPTSVSAEFTLPNSLRNLKQWKNDSYTPSKYIAAWRKVFQAYSADFPNQCVSLSVGSGLNINDQGKIDASQHLRTQQAIIDQAIDLLGSRFALQLSDVHAGPGPHSPNSENEDELVIGYNGRIITGFQMRTAAEGDSAVMGAAGDPPLALKKSINLAMEPNSSGQHVNYLEIYEPDVTADEMQTVLRYGAALFTK